MKCLLLVLLLSNVNLVWAQQVATVSINRPPFQHNLIHGKPFQFNGYEITPLASFGLEARVLSREDYWLDRESDLAPTDLALGWEQMADPNILSQIKVNQSNRWYHWSVRHFPIPRRRIETESANMHMIPANDDVAAHIDMAKTGQIIALKGWLIRADAPDGWHWQSSLSRRDVGAHACEVIYVTQFEVVSER